MIIIILDISLLLMGVFERDDYDVGDVVDISGKITNIKKNEYGVSLYLDDGFLVNTSDEDVSLSIGDVIAVQGVVKQLQEARNDGQFDQKLYYRSIGIFYKISAKDISLVSGANGYARFVGSVRERLEESFESIATEQDSSVLKAVVLGDRTAMDKDYYALYQRNGIAHLLAISGLHVSFVGMALYKLLRKSGVPCIVSFGAAAVFLTFYCSLTGNGVSARRAVIMCVVCMGAEVVGRMYDMLSSLSLAAILLVTENPYAVANSGFLLSFSAILGICIVSAPLTAAVKGVMDSWCKNVYFDTSKIVVLSRKLLAWFLTALAGSVGISLFTMPVVLYSYFEVPIFGVVLNVFVIPLMSIVLFAGIAGGVAALFNEFVGTFFMGSVHYILRFYQFLCSITDGVSFGRLCLGRPEIWQIVIYYVCLILAAWIIKNHRKKWAWSAAAVCLSLVVTGSRRSYEFQAHMIDVGQGDGIYVSAGGLKMLFDGGSTDINEVGRYRIYTFLKSHGVSQLDYVFVSHTDTDHISGISELIEMNGSTFAIKTLVLPYYSKSDDEENYVQLCRSAMDKGIRILYAGAGNMELTAGDFSLKCISPYTDTAYSDINASSAAYLVKYRDFSMLFTGDMTEESEKKLISEGISTVTCLKVAHHGSKTSSCENFIKKISPRLALISCGVDNSYGHPSGVTLDTLASVKCDIYETDKCGQISVYYDKNKLLVKTKI